VLPRRGYHPGYSTAEVGIPEGLMNYPVYWWIWMT